MIQPDLGLRREYRDELKQDENCYRVFALYQYYMTGAFFRINKSELIVFDHLLNPRINCHASQLR